MSLVRTYRKGKKVKVKVVNLYSASSQTRL